MKYVWLATARAWSMISSLLVLVIVSRHMSAEDQGYFYTFQSLGAAQFFFDLGIGFVLANVAGRIVAQPGDPLASRHALWGICRFALKWSTAAGVLLVATLSVIGVEILGSPGAGAPKAGIAPIWISYLLLVAVNMLVAAQLSILEGVGKAVEVAFARAAQALVFVGVLFVATRVQPSLWDIPLALGLSLVPSATFVAIYLAGHRAGAATPPGKSPSAPWMRDVWKLQWRIAISWIAGYFIFQAPIALLFRSEGAEAAGRLGLSLQVFQAIASLAGVLLTARIGPWTRLAVESRHRELAHDVRRLALVTCAVSVCGSLAILAVKAFLAARHPEMAERLLPFGLVASLGVAAVANQVFFCLNYYFRAQALEPLWPITLAAGVVSALVPLWLGARYDAQVAVGTYTAVSVALHAALASLATVLHLRQRTKAAGLPRPSL